VLRYNSTHTFVLAAAMDAFLKRQAGPNAHLWGMQAKRAEATSRECKNHDERVTRKAEPGGSD